MCVGGGAAGGRGGEVGQPPTLGNFLLLSQKLSDVTQEYI